MKIRNLKSLGLKRPQWTASILMALAFVACTCAKPTVADSPVRKHGKLPTMTLVHTLTFQKAGHDTSVEAFFTADGKSLICDAIFHPAANGAIRRSDGITIMKFNVLSGRQEKTVMQGGTFDTTGLSDDGRYLLARNVTIHDDVWFNEDETVEIATGRVLHEESNEDNGYGTSALSPDGKLVAISTMRGYDPVVEIRNALTGHILRTLRMNAPTPPANVVFSPDSRRIAVAIDEPDAMGLPPGETYVWDDATGQVIYHQDHTWAYPLFYVGGGEELVCDNDVIYLAHRPYHMEQMFNVDGRKREDCIGPFGSKGHLVLIDRYNATENRLLDNYEVWDVVRRRMVKAWRSPMCHEEVLAVSPDGHWLATSGDYRTPLVKPNVLHLYRVP
jgi:WD40 repeat protein